jgi:CBS domain-containing protein/sporulation protein YlmC with PRC-barrel domain
MSDDGIPQAVLLSAVIGKPVLDREGERLGTVKDLVALLSDGQHPPVIGLIVRIQGREGFIPDTWVADFTGRGVQLALDQPGPEPFTRRENELLLGGEILDRRVVDIAGKRVVRVNDLQLAGGDGRAFEYRLIGADVGGTAIRRRLIPARFAGRTPSEVIDWADVEYFASHAPEARLHISHERIARLHPVEIARLVDELAYPQGVEVIESLDDETAAATLEELAGERGADIVGELDEERAADILEEMDPDNAVDLLQDLAAEKAQDLLERMEPDDREDLQELLHYPEDTAGGVMTNSFVTVPGDWTIAQALGYLRALDSDPGVLYYLYVVPKVGSWRLTGVVSLRDLLVRTDPESRLDEVMVPASDLITIHTGEAAREVARILATYNLLAVPILDDEGDIVGIVTVDDAMDLVLPEEWRPRAARVSG